MLATRVIKNAFILFAASLLLGACDRKEKEAVLISGVIARHHEPMLSFRYAQADDSAITRILVAYYKAGSVSDAEVEIRYDSRTVTLCPVEEEGYVVYKDVQKELQIIPGTTYYLTVKVPDGRVFHAHTTVPMSPRILFPLSSDTITEAKGLRLWPEQGLGKYPFVYGSEAPSFVQFLVSSGQRDGMHYEIYNYYIDPPDSLVSIWGKDDLMIEKREFFILDSALSRYSWRLAKSWFGVDSLYDKYYLEQSAKNIREISNIDGPNGVGCFGSYGYSSVSYYVRRH